MSRRRKRKAVRTYINLLNYISGKESDSVKSGLKNTTEQSKGEESVEEKGISLEHSPITEKGLHGSSEPDLIKLLLESRSQNKNMNVSSVEGLKREEVVSRNSSMEQNRDAEKEEGRIGVVERRIDNIFYSDSPVTVFSLKGRITARVPREAREGDRGYLVDSYYDGGLGRIVLKFFSRDGESVFTYIAEGGYKPYFYTDLPPDKVRSISDIISHSGFEGIEVVEKFDVLRGKSKKLTKIVVKTPDVVPSLRSKLPRVWEANIKFHLNYIYDKGLIPGLVYSVSREGLVLEEVEIGEDSRAEVLSVFRKEDSEIRRLALEWLPLFESPPPRAHRVAVDIEVYTPFKGRVPSPHEASYPIISVALSSTDGLRAVFVLAREGLCRSSSLENVLKDGYLVEFFDDERALIAAVLEVLSRYPVVLSFNGDSFDLPYLYNRGLKLGIKRELQPFRFARDRVSFIYGVHIDLYKFFSIKAIQTYAFGNAYREFTLDAVASALLGVSKIQLDKSISELSLVELARYNMRDAELTLRLTTFNNDLVWSLIILLMRISKLPIEDVSRSQVSAWIKSLFYWEHRRRGYLIPDKDEIIRLKGRAKSDAIVKGKKYQGAIVLDPPSGIYFDVVVLDFASLYPTIIKNWNLSYETVNPLYCPGDKYTKVPDVGHVVCASLPGLTAQIVGLLRDYRVRIYKRKAKSSELPEEWRAWYKTVQAAMKVYINASYGVFGASSFPFYSPPVAESVTAIGRYAIKSALEKASELGLFVLYGDTDSLFLWKPEESGLKELIEFFDKEFGLELEVDKVYKFVTFSGLKKNYLGVYREGGVDIKGLVAKKRNTPEFLKKEFKHIVEMVKKINSAEEFIRVRGDIINKLREVYSRLRNYEYTLDELAIRVALSKNLSEYVKNTPQHVKAARQLVQVGIEVLPGDIIAFVKTKTSDGVKPVQLARLPEVDIEKYVEYMRSTFEQILRVLNITWDDIAGSKRLEMFFRKI